MRIKQTEIKVIQGDITQIKVDAIVNAANNKLLMGGGVAGTIKRKGGKIIEEEGVKKGPIEIGGAVETTAGSLPAKYVIHAATMGMDFKTDEVKIRNSCGSSLKVAHNLCISSISFPALGCGVGRFPLGAAAKIMAQEVFKFLLENEKVHLKEILFVMYNKQAFDTFDKMVNSYLTYIHKKLQAGPFITVDAIIETQDGIVLIERSNPPFGWAIPGGFVDYGESLETAVTREAEEETGLKITDLKQFHTYSRYGRDPRFHTVTTVFSAKAKGKPKADTDAKNAKTFKPDKISKLNMAFDHKQVLQDYIYNKSK